jgi:hypothetical protein
MQFRGKALAISSGVICLGCVLAGAAAYAVAAAFQRPMTCESSTALRSIVLAAVWLLGPLPGVGFAARWRVDVGSVVGLTILGALVSGAAVLLGVEFWTNLHFCET